MADEPEIQEGQETPAEAEVQPAAETKTPPAEPEPSPFARVAAEMPDLTVKQAQAVAAVLSANAGLKVSQAHLLAKSEQADLFPAAKPNVNINPNQLSGTPAPAGGSPPPRPASKTPLETAREEEEAARQRIMNSKGGNQDRLQASAAWHYKMRQRRRLEA